MSGTNVNQSTSERVINKKRTLNDSSCSYDTNLIEMEDSSSCNGFSSIPRLLGTVLHKMICAPTPIAGMFQTVAGLVTMISSTMVTYLGKLNKVTRRRGWNSSRNYMWSFISMVRAKASHLPPLFMLCMDMINMSISACNEFLSQLGMLKNFFISVGLQYSNSVKDSSS